MPIALKAGLGAAALVLVGLGSYVAVTNATRPTDEVDPASKLVFRAPKEHPVTSQMAEVAEELGDEPAPDFGLPDADGRFYSLAGLTESKPLLMFFIELECPCCKGAKDFVDRLHQTYGDVLNVVGVINADPKMTKAWTKAIRPEFPVLCDPEMKTIRAYKAAAGVYTTLVAPGGRIVEAYPGYSQGMLKSIARHVAKIAKVEERPMKVEDAPVEPISGCTFPASP
jgi:peroxiredoxin